MTIKPLSPVGFEDDDVFQTLTSCSEADRDALAFGVIGFDENEIVTVYNAPEARWAGMLQSRVLGTPMFELVAPCMNNFLVAERFRDAHADRVPLDLQLPYVLTLRMQPTPVRLRLLYEPHHPTRFILICRER